MVSQLTPLLISRLWVKLTSPHVIEGPAPPMSERVKAKKISRDYQDPNKVHDQPWEEF